MSKKWENHLTEMAIMRERTLIEGHEAITGPLVEKDKFHVRQLLQNPDCVECARHALAGEYYGGPSHNNCRCDREVPVTHCTADRCF